ncbi:TetR/AcrR family transcriptional regulator [Streptomyces sp. NPDC001415]
MPTKSPDPAAPQTGPRFRAEARKRVVDTAKLVFQEKGPDAPLEEIARRGGVGIATLYRRFPTREDLLREVCLAVMREVTSEAARAAEEEPDGWRALARVLHYSISSHAAGMLPVAAGRFLKTPEVLQVRAEYVAALTGLLERARTEGSLRATQINHVDLLLVLALLSRPLPGVDTELAQQLAHRYVDLLAGGMTAEDTPELSGPSLDQEALDALWNGSAVDTDGTKPKTRKAGGRTA